MSPELNGNPPPVTKRKKNKDKSNCSTPKLNEFNTMYSCFPNINSFPNLSIPDATYPALNYSFPAEPLSLPVYPSSYHSFGQVSASFAGNVGSNGPNIHSFPMPPYPMGSNEYMSLPVSNENQLETLDKRRYSDPGLPNESDSSSNSVDDRMIEGLTQQINSLKESNRMLSRELKDLKVELNIIKQQQTMKSVEREYEPGMLADVIREVRDAARVREDALLARVKHMIEEKQLSLVSFYLGLI